MDLLFNHSQNKKERGVIDKQGGLTSNCQLMLYQYDNLIQYIAEFSFDYNRYGTRRKMVVSHGLTINLKNGDVTTNYQLSNDGIDDNRTTKGRIKRQTNNFSALFDFTESGFFKGERRQNYWGVKYTRACDSIIKILLSKITPTFQSEYYKIKLYEHKPHVNPLFDLLVDFHLDRKKIRAHDDVYHSIQYDYPKPKWLKLNDYKYLPAILDSYGIKSKYLIGEINKSEHYINIRTISYVCGLFGENYIDYLKQIKWIDYCTVTVPNKRYHTLKNESEKRFMVKLFNNWEKDGIQNDSLVFSLNELLSIRESLLNNNLDLKFKANDDNSFEILLKQWEGYKNHFKKGYRIRYALPDDFISHIEEDIVVDGETFNVTILKTEDEFSLEGYKMKNCMGKQFTNGLLYVYIAMTHKRKRINLQYRKGCLSQQYGKANTSVDVLFNKSIQILNKKMLEYSGLQLRKEKFDFIS
jgi:hypothetical protein